MLETAEIVKASSIGTDNVASTTDNQTLNGATNKFTLTKGTVSYNDALSFNLHVGADADMTNKITVNIDSMSSAGLGVKGIKADTEQDATYAIDAIADAISTVSSQRSALGAVQNRLVSVIQIWLKRWLTTARITFLLRLDSLCLHRLIRLRREFSHFFSNL